jgi:hypothetical protein
MSVESLEATVLVRSTETAEDAAIARVVARLSGEYLLRAFQLLIETFRDIRAGLIVQAINNANISPLLRTQARRRDAGPDGSFPDDLRRPISIARLAASTGLPFESARRIVLSLVDTGVCLRVEGGVIVPRAAVRRPAIVRNARANFVYLRKFVRDLHAAGLVEPGSPGAVPADPGGAASARLAMGLSGEYLLRACQLLVEAYGDIRAGVVAQTVVTANTAYLDGRLGGGWRYAGIGESLPDDLRRPVSVARLAQSLDLPYETMRGHARRLIAAGVCERVGGGLIVPRAVLETPAANRAALTNVGYVRKFVRDLHSVAGL